MLMAIACVAALAVGRHLFGPPPIPLDLGSFSGTSVYGMSHTHRFNADLNIDDVSKLPKWDRRNPNPPISVNYAMAKAQEYRNQLVAANQFPNGSQITIVNLVPFDAKENVWYWAVNFSTQQTGNPSSEIEIAVLMDGSVVPHRIHRRIDTGWPLPDATIPERPHGTTDATILDQFVAHLNPSRRFAGLTIELTGVLTRIPARHPDLNSGQRFHFTTDDGTMLICDPPGGWALRLDEKLKITGKLLGYRNLNDREPTWDGLQLFPGIEINSVGLVRE